MSQSLKANEMGTKGVGRLLLEYSIPAILGMVVVALNQIISSIFIGYGVGPLGLAAMAVTFPLVNLLMAFCQLVAVGCAALCSIELGRKDMDKARSMLGHSVLLEIIFGVSFGLGFWFFLDPLLMFFGASGETLKLAHEFMVPLVLLSPLGFLMLGFNFLARATGYPKTAMMTALLSSLGIVVFSPVFIFWWGWGMYGAAWAQLAGQFMSVLWLVAHFCRKSSLIHFQKDIWKLNWTAFRRIVAIGMAPFLINFCACIVVVLINRALQEHGGDMAIGAFGIVNRLLMLFAMSVIGLGQGMQPIIGFNFGAKRPDRVRLALKYGMITATVITLAGMIGSWFFPELLVRIFTDHEPLVAVSTKALRIMGGLFIFVGPQIIIGTYFQSIGQAKIASVVSLCRQMICLVPALCVMPYFFGLNGVWFSIPLADFTGCMVAFFFLWLTLRAEDNNCMQGDPECKPPSKFFKPKEL
ncbi:MATE family efflux transporter [Mailhella sp.]|uniref:MATE family efflux transporter n=1 Tax=Mailhella sp. TaxID=1981029 RepID=UPI003AB6F4F4